MLIPKYNIPKTIVITEDQTGRWSTILTKNLDKIHILSLTSHKNFVFIIRLLKHDL